MLKFTNFGDKLLKFNLEDQMFHKLGSDNFTVLPGVPMCNQFGCKLVTNFGNKSQIVGG